MKIVISSGHGMKVRGASGPYPWGLDEVDEARKVTESVASYLRELGHDVITFHDDESETQSENLDAIVAFHNDQGPHDLDVSIHFNAYTVTEGERGCEVLYVTQEELAGRLSDAIAAGGDFINRGAQYRSDLAFLNGCWAPAVLLEVCFVDAAGDVNKYDLHYERICASIASVAAEGVPHTIVRFDGTCSWFGGPTDEGVAPDEGLAFIYSVDMAPGLFLPEQPPDTTGLARRLDPSKSYVACRWDYGVTSKEQLADQSQLAVVRANGRMFLAHPADWGPHEEKTGRAADLSPSLMNALGITTDDHVTVLYPVKIGGL